MKNGSDDTDNNVFALMLIVSGIGLLYIYVYSSRRQNTALNRDKKQTDRQTDTQTLQLILQHDIRKKIT